MKIAVITPKSKNDYLCDTILDGLLDLGIEFKISSHYSTSLPTSLSVRDHFLSRYEFKEFAHTADLIILCWGKTVKKFRFFNYVNTDYKTAERISKWNKTVFLDGSEVGRDGRVRGLLGKLDEEMLKKCALYFRRERPYPQSVVPLPFGIMRDSIVWKENIKKDIDFFCVFGRYDEYLPMRKVVKRELESFCKLNGFSFITQELPKEKYKTILSRSKVGISVGGGGFDTLRFWEVLGNNCILLTEKIDIYESGSNRLKYKRVFEFRDTEEFKEKLNFLGKYLRQSYKQEEMAEEYTEILNSHSSKSRVLEIIEKAKEKGIIV